MRDIAFMLSAKISFQMNCEAYLKRVLVAAWYWDITAYNFHTPDSV